MTSNQPYLLRAINQWILDNDFTPHLLINAELPEVKVPAQSVQDGQIVLNIAPHAVSNLLIDNEAVSFSARFSGVAQSIYLPISSVRAIYASENGEGMVFPEQNQTKEDPVPDPPLPNKPPVLKVIK